MDTLTEQQFMEFVRECINGGISSYKEAGRSRFIEIAQAQEKDLIQKVLGIAVSEYDSSDAAAGHILTDMIDIFDELSKPRQPRFTEEEWPRYQRYWLELKGKYIKPPGASLASALIKVMFFSTAAPVALSSFWPAYLGYAHEPYRRIIVYAFIAASLMMWWERRAFADAMRNTAGLMGKLVVAAGIIAFDIAAFLGGNSAVYLLVRALH